MSQAHFEYAVRPHTLRAPGLPRVLGRWTMAAVKSARLAAAPGGGLGLTLAGRSSARTMAIRSGPDRPCEGHVPLPDRLHQAGGAGRPRAGKAPGGSRGVLRRRARRSAVSVRQPDRRAARAARVVPDLRTRSRLESMDPRLTRTSAAWPAASPPLPSPPPRSRVPRISRWYVCSARPPLPALAAIVRLEVNRCSAGDDALGVEDEAQAAGVGERAEVDEQVVLGLQHSVTPGRAGPSDRSWARAASRAGRPCSQDLRSGEGRAHLRRPAEPALVCERLPAGDVGVAAVEGDQAASDLGGVLEDGHALRAREAGRTRPASKSCSPSAAARAACRQVSTMANACSAVSSSKGGSPAVELATAASSR